MQARSRGRNHTAAGSEGPSHCATGQGPGIRARALSLRAFRADLPAVCFALIVPLLFLVGCSPRPGPELLLPAGTEAAPPADARQVRVFMATTRGASAEAPEIYNAERERELSYSSFAISIPPGHQASEIEWPRAGAPDPATDFVTTRRWALDRKGFLSGLAAESKGKTDVVLYVHGYNTSAQEALYRAAQISVDAGSEGVPVVFTWPSNAQLAAYVSDRDAADFSRAYLADLLTTLTRSRKIGRTVVVAHSMGGRLMMEALVQLRLMGRRDVLDRLEVVLADPDIDVDLFWEQARIVGKLTPPITVIVAPDDRALRASQFLAVGHDRIGKADLTDPRYAEAATKFGVRLVDVTSLDTDTIAHSRIDQLAVLYNRLPASQQRFGAGSLRGAGAFVFEAIGFGFTGIGQGLAR